MTADMFDPYDDFPEIVPVPVAQAIEAFQSFWGPEAQQRQQDLRAQLKAGTSTPEQRKELMEAIRQRQMRVELQLFRSIMAASP